MAGAWHDSESETIFVLFPDGTMLFTFLKPPLDEPVNDWHNKGKWELVTDGDVKFTFGKMSGVTMPQVFRLDKGRLISPHGPVYKRIR